MFFFSICYFLIEQSDTGHSQGILCYGMEGKNRYGIRNNSSVEWKICCMEWKKSSIFHTNSILAYFDMVLLKSGFPFC